MTKLLATVGSTSRPRQSSVDQVVQLATMTHYLFVLADVFVLRGYHVGDNAQLKSLFELNVSSTHVKSLRLQAATESNAMVVVITRMADASWTVHVFSSLHGVQDSFYDISWIRTPLMVTTHHCPVTTCC